MDPEAPIKPDKVNVCVLDAENYAVWRIPMRNLLCIKGWGDALLEPTTKEGRDGEEQVKLRVSNTVDEQARALMSVYVQDMHLHLIEGADNAYEAWLALEKLFTAPTC
jgi:hypothetical protein